MGNDALSLVDRLVYLLGNTLGVEVKDSDNNYLSAFDVIKEIEVKVFGPSGEPVAPAPPTPPVTTEPVTSTTPTTPIAATTPTTASSTTAADEAEYADFLAWKAAQSTKVVVPTVSGATSSSLPPGVTFGTEA
jgi:hypothetical protein